MKSAIEAYLSGRQHSAGETVQFGWFVFRIAEAGSPPRIESLDFRQMASFTDDFRMTEKIEASQTETLRSFGVSECPCTLMQTALISVSYTPGHPDAFLQRQESTDANDSGWYVGILDDPADMDDVDTFSRRSLYELTIHDMRLASCSFLASACTDHHRAPRSRIIPAMTSSIKPNKGEQNGCRQRLEGYLSCQQRLALAVA